MMMMRMMMREEVEEEVEEDDDLHGNGVITEGRKEGRTTSQDGWKWCYLLFRR